MKLAIIELPLRGGLILTSFFVARRSGICIHFAPRVANLFKIRSAKLMPYMNAGTSIQNFELILASFRAIFLPAPQAIPL